MKVCACDTSYMIVNRRVGGGGGGGGTRKGKEDMYFFWVTHVDKFLSIREGELIANRRHDRLLARIRIFFFCNIRHKGGSQKKIKVFISFQKRDPLSPPGGGVRGLWTIHLPLGSVEDEENSAGVELVPPPPKIDDIGSGYFVLETRAFLFL
jgi:hypothetical protein